MNTTHETGGSASIKVKLIECSLGRCGHILTEEEQVWVPNEHWSTRAGKTATCPKCMGTSFYALNEQGQRLKRSEMNEYRNGVNLADINPSPRMGSKRKRRIHAAKSRAVLAARVKEVQP